MTMGRSNINPLAAFIPESGQIKRLIGSATWVSGQPITFDLPRGLDINRYILEVTGTITLSSAATTVSAAAPAQLIDNIMIVGDGAKTYEMTTGLMAAVANFERSLARKLTAPGTGATTHTVFASYTLDRCTPDGPRPKDSNLHTSQAYMGSLQLRVVFGTVAACYSNFGTGAVSATSLTLNVYSVEDQEGTMDGLTEFRWVRRHTLYDQTFSAANAAAVIQLPTNTYLRGVRIIGMSSSTNEPTNDLINNFILRSGPNVRLNLDSPSVQVNNTQEFNLQTTQGTAIPGLYFLELLNAHKLNSMWNLNGASECALELNVDANTRVQVQAVNYDMQPAIPTPSRMAKLARSKRWNQIVGGLMSGGAGR